MTHTVLVVEDEKDVREMLCDALELNGYSAVPAADGRSALDALARLDHVCLVLLDLVMPGMNGWDFLAQLRSVTKYETTPVIVHSSSPSAPRGATRVLTKPVDLAVLLQLAKEFC